MKYLDPRSKVVMPAVLTLSPKSAKLLLQLADDMGVTFDELISCLAEDSVINLEEISFEDVTIPDMCSTEDLLNSI